MPKPLKLPAIEVHQSTGRTLYSFAVDGKLVHRFATISRVSRKDGLLMGYQRPEALAHIEEIRNYLESPSPMVPNAIVLAFDSRVHFEPAGKRPTSSKEYSRPGFIIIPMEEQPDEAKPGFIVDGQQRLAAIRDAAIDSFPICATAFITDDIGQQTTQFMLVNSTKPLSKGLLYELLPRSNAQLPTALNRRRLPARLLERLNQDDSSPLHRLIQTTTNPTGRIKDNSILKMLEHSLNDGALYEFRPRDGVDADLTPMLELLCNYWTAVSRVFKAAWGLAPRKSRLMHGAGIVSMGLIMDDISARLRETTRIPSVQQYEADLLPLKERCHWTAGTWDFGNGRTRKWNELQNTPKDIELLARHLMEQYKNLVKASQQKVGRVARR